MLDIFTGLLDLIGHQDARDTRTDCQDTELAISWVLIRSVKAWVNISFLVLKVSALDQGLSPHPRNSSVRKSMSKRTLRLVSVMLYPEDPGVE